MKPKASSSEYLTWTPSGKHKHQAVLLCNWANALDLVNFAFPFWARDITLSQCYVSEQPNGLWTLQAAAYICSKGQGKPVFQEEMVTAIDPFCETQMYKPENKSNQIDHFYLHSLVSSVLKWNFIMEQLNQHNSLGKQANQILHFLLQVRKYTEGNREWLFQKSLHRSLTFIC